MSRMIEVMENLPNDGSYRIVYSEIFGQYYIAKHCPMGGWTSIDGGFLRNVTHYSEESLHLPFEVRGTFDEEIAKKYGVEAPSLPRGFM